MSVAEPASPQETVAWRRQALDQLGDPVRRFMRTEAGSAGLLLGATLVALAWANLSPGGYASFWGHQDALEPTDLLAHASALGLDVERFEGDLLDGRHAVRVSDDALGAEASGVRGTPTFFVGGHRHTGPTDAATLGRALDHAESGAQR